MAIQSCRECGRSVSSKAKSCPACGAPIKAKRSRFHVNGCGCLIAVLFVPVCAGVVFSPAIADRESATAPAGPVKSPEEIEAERLEKEAAKESARQEKEAARLAKRKADEESTRLKAIQQAADAAAAAKRQDANLSEFIRRLAAAGVTNSMIKSIDVKGDTATIIVDNSWHLSAYQIRLQAAQNLWNLWASIASPGDPDKARIKLTDLNGNDVGGSRVLGGSLIWVDE